MSVRFELPPVLERLAKWLGADCRREEWAAEAFGAESFGPILEGDLDSAAELDYRTPFEIVPVLWAGGDALQYALLLRAEEGAGNSRVVVNPMTSYAPGDDPSSPSWLGDTVEEGLANLLAVSIRDKGLTAPFEGMPESEVKTLRAVNLRNARAIAAALGLQIPDRPSERLDHGTRSSHPPALIVPDGWKHLETDDGIGVLAVEKAFATSFVLPTEIEPEQRVLDAATTWLRRGFPATALAAARTAFGWNCYEQDGAAEAARLMKAAYEALDRPLLAHRAGLYLTARASEAARASI
jgi:hypothetical protein